jgi:thiamine monophosphate synthase
VMEAGAQRVAVVRAIMQVSDPTLATQQLLEQIDGAQSATSVL